MAISYMDYTSPDLQFFYDLPKNTAFKTNNQNYINLLGYRQLNTIGNASILDIYLSQGHYVEPHYHQNASELVYCVSGTAVVSFINPFTNKLSSIPIKPGQVANVPQGWWHYEEAAENNTHLVAIFDAPIPEVIFGSDILRLTPAHVMAQTYCLDEKKWQEAIAPITTTVAIGPLDSCHKQPRSGREYREDNPRSDSTFNSSQRGQRYTQSSVYPSSFGYPVSYTQQVRPSSQQQNINRASATPHAGSPSPSYHYGRAVTRLSRILLHPM
ncbi:cupin domain-containing protein [Paenibacillus sp. N10]|uniref:Cupin domain-containing protein n=1 Tax=Paenibacillus lutrae TaxID=2078573 RepID=A0A7X3JXU9_9BACL|nr:cupin domain-containing protein [Paenibacillus lutrae]